MPDAHAGGTPHHADRPKYFDVVAEVRGFLRERIRACRGAGIADSHIVLDPGFGFGKTVTHNLTLLSALGHISDLGFPVLAGLSRKSALGAVTGRGPEDRLAASVAAAVIASQRGASVLRVHDVAATVDALAVVNAVATAPVGDPDTVR